MWERRLWERRLGAMRPSNKLSARTKAASLRGRSSHTHPKPGCSANLAFFCKVFPFSIVKNRT
jgi:hypothetical protein